MFPDPYAVPDQPELYLDLVPAAGQAGLGGAPIAGTSFYVHSIGSPFSKRALGEMSSSRNKHEDVYVNHGLWDAPSMDRRRQRMDQAWTKYDGQR